MARAHPTHEPAQSPVRERLLDSAYDLFSRRGVRAVGVNEVIETAGVAKATLYRHFASKDDLVLAFLERREQRWTLGWVEAEAKRPLRRRTSSCSPSSTSSMSGFAAKTLRDAHSSTCCWRWAPAKPPAGHASAILQNIRELVCRLAKEAGLRHPGSFTHSWHILMKGSIVAAGEGDVEAAQRAKAMARLLLEAHR